MTAEQLGWIKKAQREFKEKFGTVLEIDWNAMNGVNSTHRIKITRFQRCSTEEIENKLRELCEENETSIENIKNKKGFAKEKIGKNT